NLLVSNSTCPRWATSKQGSAMAFLPKLAAHDGRQCSVQDEDISVFPSRHSVPCQTGERKSVLAIGQEAAATRHAPPSKPIRTDKPSQIAMALPFPDGSSGSRSGPGYTRPPGCTNRVSLRL